MFIEIFHMRFGFILKIFHISGHSCIYCYPSLCDLIFWQKFFITLIKILESYSTFTSELKLDNISLLREFALISSCNGRPLPRRMPKKDVFLHGSCGHCKKHPRRFPVVVYPHWL